MLRTCHRVESSITDVYNKQQAYHSYKLLKCQTSELKNPEMDFFSPYFSSILLASATMVQTTTFTQELHFL